MSIRDQYDDDTIIQAARQIVRERFVENKTVIDSPGKTRELLHDYLDGRTNEEFVAIYLNTRHHVLAMETVFNGSIDGASVYPRVIAERCLNRGAAALIIAHNHPSGVAEPSLADQAITRRLKDAVGLLEIRLLDHFVVSPGGDTVSFAERGLI